MYNNELYHHGILGQKWGVRRFQNADGSLTDAGMKRYYKGNGELTRAGKKASITNPKIQSLKKTDPKSVADLKKNAIKNGDVKYASLHKDQFTNKQIEKLLERYEEQSKLDKKMSELTDRELKAGQEKYDRALSKIDKISKSSQSMYNLVKEAQKWATLFEEKNSKNEPSAMSMKTMHDIISNPNKYSDKQISQAKQRMTDLSVLTSTSNTRDTNYKIFEGNHKITHKIKKGDKK